eukprot:12034658-Alexandrium_andersonii.AAC.1
MRRVAPPNCEEGKRLSGQGRGPSGPSQPMGWNDSLDRGSGCQGHCAKCSAPGSQRQQFMVSSFRLQSPEQ